MQNRFLEASRQVEGMCHFTSKPPKVSPYFCSAKRRKWPLLDQKSARFPCENANLPHCTYFTHIGRGWARLKLLKERVAPSELRWASLAMEPEEENPTKKIHPKYKKLIWNKFFWTISVRSLTHVTRKKAEVRANFLKKVRVNASFFVFRDLGSVVGPLLSR